MTINLEKQDVLYTEKIYAVICARGGSKRVKRKNVLLVHGKPLIVHTIELSKSCKLFDDVIVNSEDAEILQIAEQLGVTTYKRPGSLALDTIFLIDVIKEMIDSMKLDDSQIIGILFPTCPLRSIEDIENALSLFMENGGDTPVVSVTSYEYPIQVALNIREDNRLEPVFPEDYQRSTRHNAHKKSYHANYSIIFNTVGNLKKQINLIGNDPIPYIMPYERSIDIDEPFQLKIAKALLAFKE
ncbi:MAG: acylneuraminate cytidylyltransferase family protein [Proteobacteria bacterium]|nr:acylneuraminate cytidylyltransferase family protein [Pseudomonadota bacterium]